MQEPPATRKITPRGENRRAKRGLREHGKPGATAFPTPRELPALLSNGSLLTRAARRPPSHAQRQPRYGARRQRATTGVPPGRVGCSSLLAGVFALLSPRCKRIRPRSGYRYCCAQFSGLWGQSGSRLQLVGKSAANPIEKTATAPNTMSPHPTSVRRSTQRGTRRTSRGRRLGLGRTPRSRSTA
jgi:hypothetical protein